MQLHELHITSERLLIRPYTIEDANALHNGLLESLEDLKPFMPWTALEPLKIEDRIGKIKEWEKNIIDDKDYTLGIFDKKTNNFIGSTGFHLNNQKLVYEIGYWVRSSCAKKGYITEASKALCGYAFKELKAELIIIACDADNERSKGIPKRLGFNLEFTKRVLEKDDQNQRKLHEYWYLFKEEWKEDF